jgi:hypothetical protein
MARIIKNNIINISIGDIIEISDSNDSDFYLVHRIKDGIRLTNLEGQTHNGTYSDCEAANIAIFKFHNNVKIHKNPKLNIVECD